MSGGGRQPGDAGAITIAHSEGQIYVSAANGGVHISDTQGQFQVSSHHNGAVGLERVTFAADSRNWIASHNGIIEALAERARPPDCVCAPKPTSAPSRRSWRESIRPPLI